MKPLNLCFLGFGNVGRALVRLLIEKEPEMRDEFGIEWRVTGVATRRMGWLASPDGLDPEALLAGETIERISPEPMGVGEWLDAAQADVLFETTSLEPFTGQPAIEHIRAALERGAHAITANKGSIIHAHRELVELAKQKGVRFMFEATVADCPVFSLFREALPAVRLLGFSAILNSTTSIIIEEMERGNTFDEGIRRAQELGITETDPGYDVDGWDAAVKTCALANVLMKEPLKLEDVDREGIRRLDMESAQAARLANRPFKLVSRAKVNDEGHVIASVRPEQVEPSDPLAMTSGTSLLLHFNLDVLPGLTVMAHQPNLKSTAYGLLADFINAVRR
jgi:homoserine dehydrogenase